MSKSTDYFSIPPNPHITEDGEYIFTVSELNHQAKQQLEQHFGWVLVKGEISNLSTAKSQHVYFSLKDVTSQVRCAFFSGRSNIEKLKITNGQQVQLKAKVSLYPDRGDFQLIITEVIPEGLGALQQAYLLLKEKLNLAGLFDAHHKKPLPAYVACLGVVTSATGAALQDILAVLRKRMPLIQIKVFDSLVQGDSAANTLCAALKKADTDPEVEVILLSRGGGSLEDLWAFNDEILAWHVFNCQTPVISAVGHEIDFVITDFVADMRAPTPSAAAELLSPDQQQLRQRILNIRNTLRTLTLKQVVFYEQEVKLLQRKLIHPKDRITHLQLKLDTLTIRLQNFIHSRLTQAHVSLDRLKNNLKTDSTLWKITTQFSYVESLRKSLTGKVTTHLQHREYQLSLLREKLLLINPLQALTRGFALVKDEKNQLVSSAAKAKNLDKIKLVFHDDAVNARILKQK